MQIPWNPANILSLARLLATIPLVMLILAATRWSLFAAAILGGIGSVYGAVAGGLIVGLAESLSVPLVGAEYRAATAFVVLIAILLIRPTGLFGERT